MTAFILAKLAPWLAALIGALGLYVKGRRDGRGRADADAMRRYHDMRERIDHADTGIGASDADRIKRLRDFAAKR